MTKLPLFVLLGAGFYVAHAAEKNTKPSAENTLRSVIAFENQNKQPGQPTVHVVTGNETLFSISKKYGVSVNDIKRWNNLKNNSISVGQSLTIRSQVATTAPIVSEKKNVEQPSPSPPKSLNMQHTVAPKETLFSIAKQYGVTVANLKEWNNIGPEGLKAGNSIWITAPAHGTSANSDKTDLIDQPVSHVKENAAKDKVINVKEITPDKSASVDKPKKESSTATTHDSNNDSGEVKESGNIAIMEGADKTKYLCWHKEAPIGTILKVKNLTNGKEVFVRVQGRLELSETQCVLRISSAAAKHLDETAPFKGDVSYYK